MLCLTCSSFTPALLCEDCSRGLSRAPGTVLSEGLHAFAPFHHRGTARRLVHILKYRGVVAAAQPLIDAMAAVLPAEVPAIVPVPRARVRAIRYGIDPAIVLARGVGVHTGIPVLEVLRPPLWWKRHAVRDRSHRGRVHFGRYSLPPPGAVLVDDVLTTGATMLAACGALEGLPTLVLTATSAGRVQPGEARSAMEAK